MLIAYAWGNRFVSRIGSERVAGFLSWLKNGSFEFLHKYLKYRLMLCAPFHTCLQLCNQKFALRSLMEIGWKTGQPFRHGCIGRECVREKRCSENRGNRLWSICELNTKKLKWNGPKHNDVSTTLIHVQENHTFVKACTVEAVSCNVEFFRSVTFQGGISVLICLKKD